MRPAAVEASAVGDAVVPAAVVVVAVVDPGVAAGSRGVAVVAAAAAASAAAAVSPVEEAVGAAGSAEVVGEQYEKKGREGVPPTNEERERPVLFDLVRRAYLAFNGRVLLPLFFLFFPFFLSLPSTATAIARRNNCFRSKDDGVGFQESCNNRNGYENLDHEMSNLLCVLE